MSKVPLQTTIAKVTKKATQPAQAGLPDEPILVSPKVKARYERIRKEIKVGKGIYKPKDTKEFFKLLSSE